MKSVVLFFFLFLIPETMVIFDFEQNSDLSNWQVVDDVVMGGRSAGQCAINTEGNAVFRGQISLENNGGFSSLRYRFAEKKVDQYSKAVIRLKGDGNRYQFRIKSNQNDWHSYISYFQTTGDWQTIEIPLSEMYPTFRGRRLDQPNYPGESLAEVAFLIGNKKEQNFNLEIDWIGLE